MAASAWAKYNSFPLYMGQKKIDFSADTFKIALFTSSSNANDPTKLVYGDLTNELSTANGYTAGGATLTSVSWTQSTVTVTFSCAAAAWTASGGSITARYAVIYDSTPTTPLKPLICWTLLDTTPADAVATNGTTFTVNIHASGILTETGM